MMGQRKYLKTELRKTKNEIQLPKDRQDHLVSQNPFQAPTPVQPVAEKPVPPKQIQGVWSDGQYLVVAQNATLPSVCVVTNQKPVKAITRSFYWHHPAVYISILAGLLIFVILALVLRKNQKLALPVSEMALQKRKGGLLKCWAAAALCILGVVGSFVLMANQNGASDSGFLITMFLLFFGFIGLLVSAVVGSRYASVLRPKKITDQAGWYVGASPEYLARFPAVPPNVV